MAFYYVKSGGTATGDGGRYTTAKTGSWATAFSATSEYYDNIQDVRTVPTTALAIGDRIYISDAHTHTYTSTATYFDTDLPFGAGDEAISWIVVDDDDVTVYSPATGIMETVTGSNNDLWFAQGSNDDNKLCFYGLGVQSADDIGTLGNNDSKNLFFDCIMRVTGSSDTCFTGSGELHNCTLQADGHPESYWVLGSNPCFGCVFTTDQSSKTRRLFAGVTGTILAHNCDFSASKATRLLSLDASDKALSGQVLNCKLPAELTSFAGSQSIGRGVGLLVANSSATSAAAEYQYHFELNNATADDDTAFYRDDSTAFPSGQKISIKCTTSTSQNRAEPFKIILPTRYVELSSSASDTLTVYLLSSDSGLTDADVFIDVWYPDGTNKHEYNRASSVGGPMIDPLRTGVALDSDTSAWTGRTTESRYKIDVDTSGDAGADSVPQICVWVTKPSITVYFCPTLGLS